MFANTTPWTPSLVALKTKRTPRIGIHIGTILRGTGRSLKDAIVQVGLCIVVGRGHLWPPGAQVLAKGRRFLKLKGMAYQGTNIPHVQRLIELLSSIKHAPHADHAARLPGIQGLIETKLSDIDCKQK